MLETAVSLRTESTAAGAGGLSAVIEARLRQSPYLELRRISCTLHDRVLRLQGYVSSYYLRQVAQTLLMGLDGVEAIDNNLEVLPGRNSRDRWRLA